MTIEDEIKQTKFASPYHKLAINLIYSSKWFEFFLKENFKSKGLTIQQYNILRILRGSRPHPLSTLQIRERMMDKMSDTSRIVDRLVAKGLVSKKISKSDNRLVEVRITSKGLILVNKLNELDQKTDDFLGHLSEEEAKQLSNLLDKMHTPAS